MYEDYEDLVERLRECTSEQNGEKTLWCQAGDAIDDLLYICKHQADEIRELKNQWIPVTERLPEEKINPYTHDFEPIICATNFGDVRVYKYGTPTGWDEPHFWNGAGIVDWYVTHWMPLPEPPKDGE